MRIVAVADTHTFQDDLGAFPDGDVLIHAGDLCRGGRLEELKTIAAWLRDLPHRRKVVIAGNHDWCFVREPQAAVGILGQGVDYLQDSEVTIGGVRLWGSPWQPEFNGWAFNLPRGEPLARKWELIPTGIDVLITHGPPHGIGDWPGDSARQGCKDLFAAVRRVRPSLHVFGHIHQDGGFWVEDGICFANVTCWECERGPTVIYDHQLRHWRRRRMSNWIRVEPTISLNDPKSRFRFASDGADVELRFRDWRNRSICIRFADVSQFRYSRLPPEPSCPEGEFCYLDDSPLIERLRQSRLIEPGEKAYHYVIGSNDEEWCEIVAATHGVTIGD